MNKMNRNLPESALQDTWKLLNNLKSFRLLVGTGNRQALTEIVEIVQEQRARDLPPADIVRNLKKMGLLKNE